MSLEGPLRRRALLVGAALAPFASRCQIAPAAPPSPRGGDPSPREPSRAYALRVEVWHDTVCPWCRIGLHNLGTALDAMGARGRDIEVVYHPFLLEPETPDEGTDLRERLGRRYGAERVEGMFARVAEAGAQYGLHFSWDRVRRAPQTVRSHALVEHARGPRQRAVLEAVHRAYFEEGQNIGEAALLASLGRDAGLERARALAAVNDPTALRSIRARAAEASARGIDGVPHFVLRDRVLHGAQPPDALRAALEAALRG